MPFEFKIDSDLPLPLGAQLRGLIEYGIACGELPPGSRLPSVRSLADQLGIAPMTVSAVFRDLQDADLIESRPGRGTYVRTNIARPAAPATDAAALRERVDALVTDALAGGISPVELSAMVTARLNRFARRGRPVRIAMVGTFAQTTPDFAADLQARLQPDDTVTGLTVDALADDAGLRARISDYDLVLTFTNRITEVAELLGDGARVMGISYIPSDKTRLALAGLDARHRVGLVSTFDTFLPVMQSGVQRLAPQAGSLQATVLGHPDLDDLLSKVEIVIYATGAEEVATRLPRGVQAFEYRHALHPLELEQNVLPQIEHLRGGTPVTPPISDAEDTVE